MKLGFAAAASALAAGMLHMSAFAADRDPVDLCRPVVLGETVVATHPQIVQAGKRVTPPGLVGPTGFDWTDTFLGVAREASGRYLFFGSDGSCHFLCNRPGERDGSFTRTAGTLDDPLGHAKLREAVLPPRSGKLPPDVLYVGGGPVYRVPRGSPAEGALLLVYHAERATYQPGYHYPDCNSAGFCNAQQNGIWSYLGLATSMDEGRSWLDVGPIIEGNTPYGPQVYYDIGEGDLVAAPVRVGEAERWFHVYFPDDVRTPQAPGGAATRMSVARVSYDLLLRAIASGTTLPAFHKYFDGAWKEPGLGGASTDLLLGVAGLSGGPGQHHNMLVVWNSASAHYAGFFNESPSVGYSESPDGLHWSSATTLRARIDGNNQVANYTTPVGLGPDPGIIGDRFYIYYDFQQYYGANAGWPSAELRRIAVACSGAVK